MFIAKFCFGLGFAIVFALGFIVLKNFDTWFGAGSDGPSETEAAVLLNKTQVIVLWLLAMKLMLMMTIIV